MLALVSCNIIELDFSMLAARVIETSSMVVDDDECVENKAPLHTIGRHRLNEGNAVLWRVRIGRAWINSMVTGLSGIPQ